MLMYPKKKEKAFGTDTPFRIFVDQVGYLPDSRKVAVIPFRTDISCTGISFPFSHIIRIWSASGTLLLYPRGTLISNRFPVRIRPPMMTSRQAAISAATCMINCFLLLSNILLLSFQLLLSYPVFFLRIKNIPRFTFIVLEKARYKNI